MHGLGCNFLFDTLCVHDLHPKMDRDARMILVMMNMISEGYRFVNEVHELRDGYVHVDVTENL